MNAAGYIDGKIIPYSGSQEAAVTRGAGAAPSDDIIITHRGHKEAGAVAQP
jgi:hypothetical protein